MTGRFSGKLFLGERGMSRNLRTRRVSIVSGSTEEDIEETDEEEPSVELYIGGVDEDAAVCLPDGEGTITTHRQTEKTVVPDKLPEIKISSIDEVERILSSSGITSNGQTEKTVTRDRQHETQKSSNNEIERTVSSDEETATEIQGRSYK